MTDLDLETDARKNLPQVNEGRNPEGRMPRPGARASSAISSAVGTRASAISVHMAHTSQQLSKNSEVNAKSGYEQITNNSFRAALRELDELFAA